MTRVMAFFNRMKGIGTAAVWFGIIMIIAVCTLAFTILFTDAMADRIYGNKRIIFVVMLLAYAVYRGFRLYQLVRLKNGNE